MRQVTLTVSGRLRARPIQPGEIGAGLHPLGLDDKRDGLLYVPASYRRDKKIPLVLMLHGSKDDGGDSEVEDALNILRKVGYPLEMIVLAVESRSFGWDDLLDGPDLAFIDRALAQTFDRYTIDPSKVAITGFSHGASYALSAGLTNGDLFTHVIAFSPNHMAPKVHLGRVRLFISQGKNDKFRS